MTKGYGINAYKAVGIKDDLMVADPHRVIQLLMQGALENMAKAKGAIERRDFAVKSQLLGKSMSIILALQASLDMSANPDIAGNLWSLYDFMINHLSEASTENDVQKVQDVMDILLSIKFAWDQIPVSDRQLAYNMRTPVQAAG